jgi:hypothetical protein
MRTIVLLLIGLLTTIHPIDGHAQVPDHPRLIVVNQDLHTLTHPSGTWETWSEREGAAVLSYRSIVLAAEDLCRQPIGGPVWMENFVDQQTGFYHNIKTLAMAHLLRRAEPYDDAYLDYACATLDTIRTTGFPMWYTVADPYNTDLNTSEMLAGWALAFDWLYQDMTAGQIANNVDALYHLLANQDYAHVVTGLNDNNHISVCFGGRGLACLALETHCTPLQDTNRRRWLTEARSRVVDYLDWGFGDCGAGFEGVFYSMYGLNTALPFGLATDRLIHLPSDQRVDVMQRHVQQAGTWLCYEQLPFDPAGCTPINDTDRPPWDLNNPPMKPYPWLMAFASPERPTGAKLLFLTQYPPEEWDEYLAMGFDPDAPDANACLFSTVKRPIGGPVADRNRSAVDVLLSWPDDSAPPGAFYESLRPGRAFTGRGIVFFREEALKIEDGRLVSDPNGWLLTFESQLPPGWTTSGHQGHRQNDTNHFLYYWNRHAIAYDGGFRGFSADLHNARNIRAPGQSWREPTREARGSLVRHLEGTGIAPSFAIGDDAAGWNWSSELVDRAQRSFVVIPRSGGKPPFVLIHDDLDFAGVNAWESRFFWQTEENSIVSAIGRDRARSVMSETAADMVFLRPAPISPPTVETIDPPSPNWPPHPRVTINFGASTNPNVIALLEPYLMTTGPSLTVTPIAQANPNTYACVIADDPDFYVVVLRQADAAGVVTLNVDGGILTTDARHTVLHFGSDAHSWSDIRAGLMVGGTRVWYDDRYVMGIYNDSMSGDLTFDSGEVSVAFDTGGSTSPEYYVGPVIPRSAVVNGAEQSTDMIDLPHPLRSSFPTRVCRSPDNSTAPPDWQYTVEVSLRTAEGNPVTGWPADRVSMDIRNCPNPRIGLGPEGPSDADGNLIWLDGLDSGGSHQVAGGSVVVVNLDYGADGVRRLYSNDSVTSPDEDGDSDVDEDDFVIWNEAYELGSPLHVGDLNRDGVVTWDDYSWMKAHGLPGDHSPRLVGLDLKVVNPARSSATINCHIPAAGPTRLDIFDVRGRLVTTLFDGSMPRGVHPLTWNGEDGAGKRVGSGVYLLRLRQGGVARVARLVLLH